MTRRARNLLAFLVACVAVAGAPTLAHAHGSSAGDGSTAVDSAPAPPRAAPGSAEARLRAFETKALGAEHAVAHARQRELARTAQRDGATTQLQARDAPLVPVPEHVGGKWDAARPIPVIAINAIMLPTRKVLMFAYPARPGYGESDYAKAYVWDPDTGTSDEVPPPIDPGTGKPTNIWCGGASFLPDGRVLVTGGNVDNPATDFHGLNTAFVFDPVSQTWDDTRPSMAQGRWYPSQVLMPDGRTLIAGGLTRPGDRDYVGYKTNNDLELISPSDGAIERQQGFFNGAGEPQLSGLYPRMFWMPSGRALSVGPFAADTWFLNPSSPGTPTASTDVPNRSTDREWGSAVLLTGGRVMIMGGSQLDGDDPDGTDGKRPAQGTTEVFDEKTPGAGWQPAAPMAVARSHANGVLLPDGKVATVGGGEGEDSGQQFYRWLSTPDQKRVELFDPARPSVAPVLGNAQAEARTYHSTALLLPDGRVMSAGDDINGADGPGTPSGTNSDTAEIYSPPYLFKADDTLAPRPVIGSELAPAQAGETIDVQTSGPAATKAVLVAPGAATHATDMSQRLVPLAAPQPVPGQPGHLAITLPSNVNLAPPGFYMLFLLSANGVPSVSKFIRVDAPTDTTAPIVTLTAPADGSSTTDTTPTYSGAAGDLSGDRAAATVRVYAGPTATGTLVQTRTAARSGTSWTVDGSSPLSAGTYTARAEQSDYTGNTGLSTATTFTIPGPPAPHSPPRPPSKPTLTITGALPSLRTLKRKKRFVLTVSVSEPGTVTLDGLLERSKTRLARVVRRPNVTFTAAGKRRVTFKLTRAGLRLLAHRRRGVVRIRATSVFKSGHTLPMLQVRRKLR